MRRHAASAADYRPDRGAFGSKRHAADHRALQCLRPRRLEIACRAVLACGLERGAADVERHAAECQGELPDLGGLHPEQLRLLGGAADAGLRASCAVGHVVEAVAHAGEGDATGVGVLAQAAERVTGAFRGGGIHGVERGGGSTAGSGGLFEGAGECRGVQP